MNPLIIFAFLVMTLLSFGVVMYILKPTPEQKAVDQRLVAIKTKQGEFSAVNERLDQFLKPATEAKFGWVEDLVDSSAFAHKLRILILQADSKTSLGSLLISCIGTGAAVGFVTFLFTGMVIAAGPAGLVCCFVPIILLKIKRARRLKKFEGALADSIDMMARSLRAGHSLVAAISIVAEQALEPVKSEFAEVFKKQNFGLPLRECLMQMLDRVASQDLRVLVTGILVQKDTGGNLAEILDRITNVIRERVRIKGEIKTHTAQGRLTGWILCALPIVMLVLINMINPGYSNVLFHDPFGQKMLGGGVVLLLMGGFSIRHIINKIEV
jgi:tight adherence protein B